MPAEQLTEAQAITDRPADTPKPPLRALLVEPSGDRLREHVRALEACGIEVVAVRSGAEALEQFQASTAALAVISASVHDVSAAAIVRHVRVHAPHTVIVVTAPTLDVATATELMRAGATEVVDDLGDTTRFMDALRRTLDSVDVQEHESATSRRSIASFQFFTRYQAIFRGSEAMRRIERFAMAAARTDDPLLIEGEPGTGKHTIARTVHHLSARGSGPFVRVRVAAIPPDGLESVLFGEEHASGRRALVEEAHRGTLFIDEAFDLPPDTRQRLTALGADGRYVRRRSRELAAVDLRLIWATTSDVRTLLASGAVSAAAVEALGVLRITMPPLRERREEIPALVEHFRHLYSRRIGRTAPPPPPDAMQMLRDHAWPANVSELENVVKRWVAFQDPEQLRQELRARARPRTGPGVASGPRAGMSLAEIGRHAAREAERRILQETLEQVRGNRAAAARALKVSYKTLLQKLGETGLDNRQKRGDKL
jgi:DNA-binding NtrC family response regulator